MIVVQVALILHPQ